jgi:tRNA-dihydrouridine synthase 3
MIVKERICKSITEGVPCQQGENCPYIHDLQEYMKLKPEDIGTTCYQFQTFGYCPNGIMCRFGGSHIDKATCMNVARPPESGIH